MNLTLEEAIERLRLPELSRRLGIAGEIPERDGRAVRCFFPDRHHRGDRKPSFNFYGDLTAFKCHGCGIAGRGPDLISMTLGLDQRDSIQRFISMAEGKRPETRGTAKKSKLLRLPPDLHDGTEKDWNQVAELRHLDPKAVALAAGLGVLQFGTVLEFPCWLVTDQSRTIAEARRMDGKLFPKIGSLNERKAHTLAGSRKAWPVGLSTRHSNPALFRRIAWVEGGPDLIAAYHFLLEQEEFSTLPISMLGKSCKTLDPRALRLLKKKRVRIFPHNDEDGGGMKAAKQWSKIMQKAGIRTPDAFCFDGLLQSDGTPVNDLNDCTNIRESDRPALRDLFCHE